MAKLISDLKPGDKIFIIDKLDRTFDVAEVIGSLNYVIKIQCYLNNYTLYIWKYQESKYETLSRIIFIDETEAIKEFKNFLNN